MVHKPSMCSVLRSVSQRLYVLCKAQECKQYTLCLQVQFLTVDCMPCRGAEGVNGEASSGLH